MSAAGSGVTVTDNFGEKKDGVVTAQWYDCESHYRYVLIRMKMDVDDADDLEEMQAEMEKQPQPSGSSKKPARKSAIKSED